MSRRDQILAVTAWQLVGGLPADPKLRAEFRTRAVGLGPMLVSSGLAATAAFHAAKAGPNPAKPRELAYARIADALGCHVLHRADATRNDLVAEVGAMASTTYASASGEARAFALWVRRAAEALIPRSEQAGNAAALAGAAAHGPVGVPDGAGAR
ncbi:type III-B CRISPR module-associated protein Cmr5 [Frankia canadensis]|uniref:type III-B CRISPR module-associated protein Cmr5 n=1 Tax=Frankia canadensis TaxID=1836972 RepID=UPI00140264C3|nr:type III-B CRISPR module-associated protein Cmr5 [Frankia canadensis]